MEIKMRPLVLKEMSLVCDFANSIYPPAFHESIDSFKSKFKAYPEGCIGLFLGNELKGYIIGHPWKGEEEVPLNCVLKGKIKNPDCFYLQDIVVSPDLRGKGWGNKLIDEIIKIGRENKFRKMVAVAVSLEGKKMLEKKGFSVVKEIEYSPGILCFKMVCIS